MYIIAAHIVSTYTGSFTAFVKQRIFDTLNMTSTTYSLSDAVRSGEITQAWTSIGKGRRVPHWFDDEVNQLLAGAGGIITNAADLVCDCLVNSYFFANCLVGKMGCRESKLRHKHTH